MTDGRVVVVVMEGGGVPCRTETESEDEGVFLAITEPADHYSPSFSTPSRFQVANSP